MIEAVESFGRRGAPQTRERMIILLIRRMSATFGKLNQETLELAPGLNILQAPNETGKSTWCAFLLAMLYGVNSRERDRAGFIADKNRYAPWFGAAMAGRLDCRAGEDELTLLRETRRQSAPMGEGKAVFAGTGDPVPALEAGGWGEALLGVSREVFERSAFIRQTGLAISQDAGLERRIAALITTGEEDTSYTEAAEALKKQLNRRRHNRTGQLPALEGELAEVRRQLEELAGLDSRLAQARQSAEALEARGRELEAQLALHDRWEAARRRQAADEAESAAVRAEQRAAALRDRAERERLPENEAIARLRGAIVNLETVRKSVDKAMAEKDQALQAAARAEADCGGSPFAGKTAEEARKAVAELPPEKKTNALSLGLCSVLGLLAGVGASLVLLAGAWMAAAGGAGLAIGLLIAALLDGAEKRKRRRQIETGLKGYGASSPQELTALAENYGELCRRRDGALAAATAAAATYDALYASLHSNEQGILMEVRRFAPAAFDMPTADAALRECAMRRKELRAAEDEAREARLRRDLLGGESGGGDDPPDGEAAKPQESRESLGRALAEVRGDLAAARSAADHLAGQRAALGDGALLTAQAEQLAGKIGALEGEYEAIALAMDTLDEANTALQNRFAPALGRRTAEIFARLTGGAYAGVVLDRSFRLAAEPAGDSVYRDAQLLSAGASDQLYLAARLAICELVLPEERQVPIVLDDALANFDDERMEAALRWLKTEAERRQILLFTCHRREAEFFRGERAVAVRQLTAGGAVV